jgi:hypothetical protein
MIDDARKERLSQFFEEETMFSSNKGGVKTLMEKRSLRMIPLLDERQNRLYLANEAMSYGRGGISVVNRIRTGTTNLNI